ncbi:acetylornithine aminotransferase [mine drainage metagenome]|uniref:Acetylornithine aminotransferase n=1 Tax=mine drainage metagenome TaxID=410659 RepID=A0A1J5QFA1_9ZZZZ
MTHSSAKADAFIEQWRNLMQSNYGAPRIALVRGNGAQLTDAEGRNYTDFIGGIATNVLGQAHPAVTSAVYSQIQELAHVSNLYAHPRGLELAEKLREMSGDSSAKVFFANSGAEVNEAAFKLSRLTGRTRVIAMQGAFHGRTMGALSLTGQPSKADPFRPLPGDVFHVPYGDVKAVADLIDESTAMVIVEPIQGEAGVITPPLGYLSALRELTYKHGALLAIDEVQTGMGRTGDWFAYQAESISPDIVTMAKGLGGGLPMGAMLAMGEAANLLQPGSHGSTFGGNPVVCAAALATISTIETDGLLASNRALGKYLAEELQKMSRVAEVRGRGLLIGIGFRGEIALQVQLALEERGFLTNAASAFTLRLAPPYVITRVDIDRFIHALAQILEEVAL